jgi:uncharacterized iron-regulated membrane protein
MNQRIRRVVFWLHLGLGIAAGSVILVMAVTGTLLAYERQVVEWADRDFRSSPRTPGAALPTVEALLAGFRAARPGEAPSGLSLQSDPLAPALVNQGREHAFYLDRTTGRLLGEGSPAVRGFFRAVTGWHRWLALEGERREVSRKVTGACNLAFLGIVVSGLYLWLPRRWSWRQVRNVAWFRRGLAGKARDFNWHNVFGLWLWVPLVLVVGSGVVLSYPWAGDLLYRLSGEAPPPRRAEGERSRPEGDKSRPVSFEGLDELWARAEAQLPGWRTVSLRVPEAGAEKVTFTILRGHRGRPDLRSQLTLDRRSGATVTWETYSTQSTGRKLRVWSRWVHTGEAGGWLGQTLAVVVSSGVALLVWTGWAMAWRRFVLARFNS